MKKSIMIFLTAAVFSVGTIVWGWSFVNDQVGAAVLTEETIEGSKAAADWLTVEFRADSADDLHWKNSFDYSTGQTTSTFKRGELEKKMNVPLYDEIRFTGWSTVPYSTQLKDRSLAGSQEKKIHGFYDEIQQQVMKSGKPKTGKIRLRDYLDYYPVSFRFQFGTRIYHSDNALTGLKVYDEADMLSPENRAVYDEEIDMYTAFHQFFKIPVIENEFQEYQVSKVEKYDPRTSLGYKTDIKTPLGAGEDFYTFDPIIVIQEENILDGKSWYHPDLSGGLTYETGDESDTSYVGKSASEYDRKNRMLFIVNNRTAKGSPVDVSQITGGYGVYELPIEVSATATVRHGQRSGTLPNPKPVCNEMKMVYPLDACAEYVEMSLSGDHRYLAVLSVKDGDYFAELIDADTWTSAGPMKVFPASEKMSYAWGEDGSLVMTNHQGYVAVISKTDAKKNPYEVLFSENVGDDFVQAFFDGEMTEKVHSASRYQCGVEQGLSVAENGGKAALVQNLLVGDDRCHIRNAALTCAVIGGEGILYRGNIKSNLVDLDYDMTREEIEAVKDFLNAAAEREANALEKSKPSTRFSAYVLRPAKIFLITSAKGELGPHFAKYMIEPVRNENHAQWR